MAHFNGRKTLTTARVKICSSVMFYNDYLLNKNKTTARNDKEDDSVATAKTAPVDQERLV